MFKEYVEFNYGLWTLLAVNVMVRLHFCFLSIRIFEYRTLVSRFWKCAINVFFLIKTHLKLSWIHSKYYTICGKYITFKEYLILWDIKKLNRYDKLEHERHPLALKGFLTMTFHLIGPKISNSTSDVPLYDLRTVYNNKTYEIIHWGYLHSLFDFYQ